MDKKATPIGLLPKEIFYKKFAKDVEKLKLQYPIEEIYISIAEQRIEDMKKVISEYMREKCAIPVEWVQEYNALIFSLNQDKENQRLNAIIRLQM